MIKKSILPLLIFASLLMGACKEKKQTRTIITKVEVPKVSKETKAMTDETAHKNFKWGSTFYDATISRKVCKDVPKVKDEYGNKYYDNSITLTLTGGDATIMDRVFYKTDFLDYVDSSYIKPSNSVLVNIAYEGVEGGKAVFVATVGSPDAMDDEYMYIKLCVTKSGEVSMSKAEMVE